MEKKYGYIYSFKAKIIKFFVKFLIKVLFLDKNTFYSNEFIQNLNPTGEVYFDKKKIIYRTGHNRLDYRFKAGISEEPLMERWIQKMKDGDVLLDIGANVGSCAIPSMSQGAFVYAFELDSRNAGILIENIVLNKFFDRGVVFPFGIGKNDSLEKIFYRDFSVGDAMQSVGHEQRLPILKSNPFEISQPIFNLDKIFSSLKLKQPNKVKIDVDGNEEIVFEGGKKTILAANEIYFEDNGFADYILEEIVENNFKLIDQLESISGVWKATKNIIFIKN